MVELPKMGTLRGRSVANRAVIINDFADVRGGASTQAVKLAGMLATDGWDVCFFSGADPLVPIPEVTHVSVGQVALLNATKATAALTGLYNRHASRALETLIRNTDTPRTIYHVHGWSQILSPSIFRALEQVEGRVVMHAHDFSMACPNIVYFNFPKNRTCDQVPMSPGCVLCNCDKRSAVQKVWRVARHGIYRNTARRIRNTAPVIAAHENMEPILRRGGVEGKVNAVRNTSDALLPSPVRAEENQNIVFLGQLLGFKGVIDLAHAARQARTKLLVVGDGPERAKMEAIYPDGQYVGWQQRDTLGVHLATARALVVPTVGIEPFGVVVAEAAQCGIPVIVSDSLFLADQITELGIGVSYPAGDIAALAKALEQVAQDDALVARLSRNAVAKGTGLSPSEGEWLERITAVYLRRLEETAGNGTAAASHARVTP